MSVAMPSYTPQQIAAIGDPTELQKLDKDLVQHVTPQQVPNLADKQFEHLVSKEQVAAVPGPKCKLLPERLVKHVLPTQVPHLNPDQLLLIVTREQVESVPPKLYWRLPPSLVPLLPDNADLGELLSLQYPHLTSEQVARIRNPKIVTDMVRGIADARTEEVRKKGVALLKFIDPAAMRNLAIAMTPDLVKKIESPEFLRMLPDTLVEHVSAEQVEHLSTAQLPLLKTGEQVKAVKWHQLSYLTAHQYANLSTCQKVVYVVSTVIAGIFSAVLSLAILPLLLIPSVREWSLAPAGRMFSAAEHLCSGR